jgi:hypothetical protein
MTAASLERIVRPALAAQVGPPRRTLETQARAVDEANLIFGGPGQSAYSVAVTNYGVGFETKTQTKEVQRTVDEIRVFNPEDKNQYVDTESVRSVILQGRDGKKTEQIFAKYRQGKNDELRKSGVTHKNPDTALPIG